MKKLQVRVKDGYFLDVESVNLWGSGGKKGIFRLSFDEIQDIRLVDKDILCHVNPNCKDVTRCKPHGEFGKVDYRDKDISAVPPEDELDYNDCTHSHDPEKYYAPCQICGEEQEKPDA